MQVYRDGKIGARTAAAVMDKFDGADLDINIEQVNFVKL